MYYEMKLTRQEIDEKGNEKNISEQFITDESCEFFMEAEKKGLELYNNECDVIAISRSNIREFVNKRTKDEESVYKATIEDTFVNDDGSEKKTKYYVALFAETTSKATEIVLEYMRQGLNDMELVAVKKTKILDII